DLGEAWERVTASPVPLGGILARLDLPESVHHNLNAVIRDSLDYAYANRQEVLGTILQYAQELDEALIWDYIDLYVNAYSRDLGDEGRRAVENLEHYARRAGVLAPDAASVRFLD
ncbi:MqnA/MqnD/SBP family protein, partial [Singulisphaera rosea]